MSVETIRSFSGTARVHLGLSVAELERSRHFYEALLGVAPAKVRGDYVKFESLEPSLNLTLEPGRGGQNPTDGSHFGIELRSVHAVEEAAARLQAAGLTSRRQRSTCCYARQDKVWVSDPDGRDWELFVVLSDSETYFDEKPKEGSCTTAACATSEMSVSC